MDTMLNLSFEGGMTNYMTLDLYDFWDKIEILSGAAPVGGVSGVTGWGWGGVMGSVGLGFGGWMG